VPCVKSDCRCGCAGTHVTVGGGVFQQRPPANRHGTRGSLFGLPGKDWRICYQVKNKAAMRARLQTEEQGGCWFAEIQDPPSQN